MSLLSLPVDMSGKRILVTAGGSGIGRAIALAFHGRGASVFICDIDGAGVAATVASDPDRLFGAIFAWR